MRKILVFSAVGVALVSGLVILIGHIQTKNEKAFSPEEEVFY
jgi:hypothetical protein